MFDIEPELVELGKTLKQQFVMHIRGRESVLSYRITAGGGRAIGHKTVVTVNKTGKSTTTYAMGDDRFETVEAFLKAYRQRLRDEEFDAAAPKAAEFCKQCGAGIPPREGEGTCPACDPQGCKQGENADD